MVITPPEEGTAVYIDCNDCRMQHTEVCSDCIVTALLDRDDRGAVVLDLEHERAVRRLQDAGLAPQSRFTGKPVSPRRTGT